MGLNVTYVDNCLHMTVFLYVCLPVCCVLFSFLCIESYHCSYLLNYAASALSLLSLSCALILCSSSQF